MDYTQIISEPLETQTEETIPVTQLVEEQNTMITEAVVSEEKQLPSPPANTPPLPMKPLAIEQLIEDQSNIKTDELSINPSSNEMKSHEEEIVVEIIEEKHDLQSTMDIDMKMNDEPMIEKTLESIPVQNIEDNTETFAIQNIPEIENQPTINDNELKHPSPAIKETTPVINDLNEVESHVTLDMISTVTPVSTTDDIIMVDNIENMVDNIVDNQPSTTEVVNDNQKQSPVIQRQATDLALFTINEHPIDVLSTNTPLIINAPNSAIAPNVMDNEVERVVTADINMDDKNTININQQTVVHHQPSVTQQSSSSSIMKEELTKCLNLVIEFMNRPETEPFNEPVDWQALSLPDYPLVCPKPMDLGTIRRKLEHGQYSTPYAFADEFRLVFTNAKTYNTPGSGIYVVAENLHKQFERRFPRICQQSHRHRKKMRRGNEKKSTFAERQKFVQLLNEIGGEDIGRVVELIDKLCPCALSDMSNNEELEIQVYHLDGNTILELIQFIDKIKKKRMAAASHKKMRLQ